MRSQPIKLRFFCCSSCCLYCCCGFYCFCSCSYWVKLWSIQVRIPLLEATVVVVDFVVVVVVDVVVNFVVVDLLVVTDHIILSCGQ